MCVSVAEEDKDMITEYHRPLTLDEALALAANPDSVIIGGGTTVNAASSRSPVAAVDLQALDLSGIKVDGAMVQIGATTRLQEMVDSNQVPTLLSDLARREAPNTIRNAATVGGTIGTADPESQLLTGLLAFGCTVNIAVGGTETAYSLEEILDDRSLLKGAIMTSVSVPTGGSAAADRTARTPMDQPIVMAVAHRDQGGSVRLALAGVAALPIVVQPDQVEELDPPSDFRGSTEYRSRIASVLAGRVVAAVTDGA
jgi:CO/xanthine dehydrogenase FAD-binding subunit